VGGPLHAPQSRARRGSGGAPTALPLRRRGTATPLLLLRAPRRCLGQGRWRRGRVDPRRASFGSEGLRGGGEEGGSRGALLFGDDDGGGGRGGRRAQAGRGAKQSTTWPSLTGWDLVDDGGAEEGVASIRGLRQRRRPAAPAATAPPPPRPPSSFASNIRAGLAALVGGGASRKPSSRAAAAAGRAAAASPAAAAASRGHSSYGGVNAAVLSALLSKGRARVRVAGTLVLTERCL